MPNYYWYEPADVVSEPVPSDVITYNKDSFYSGQFDQRIRAHPEYLRLEAMTQHLHSMIRNQSFESMQESQVEELRNIVDMLFFLRLSFDTTYYTGDEEDFQSKVGNVLETLNYAAPLFFTKYLNADVGDWRDSDKERDWLRQLIHSIYLQRKWAGSLYGYHLPIKLLQRLGAIYLRAQYISDGNFTIFSDRYFRLMSVDSYKRILPGGTGSVWPNTGHVLGNEDYSQASIEYFRWDTFHTFDEEISVGSPLKWDSGLVVGNEGKGLLLDITLDRLLHHQNTLGTQLCLLDNPWLLCASQLLPSVRRGADKIMIGSQISLVALPDGRYTNTVHPAGGPFVPGTPEYDQEQRASYTHPNINAKFEIFPQVWDVNSEIGSVEIGTGQLAPTVFMGATDDPVDPGRVVPTELAEKLFKVPIGQYEKTIVNGYYAITPTIHKSTFLQKTIFRTLSVGGSITPDGSVAETILSVPHEALARGSVTFTIRVALSPDPVYDRYIQITDYFVAKTQQYDTRTVLFKKNIDGAMTPVQSKVMVEYFKDQEYSGDFDFFEWNSDDVVSLLPIIGHPRSTGEPAFAYIDYDTGSVTVRLKVNPNSFLGKELTTLQTIGCSMECSYSVNTVQRENQEESSNQSADDVNVIGITEVGVFNTTGGMLAYGVFPPIIYDASKFHLSLNLLLPTR